MGNVPTIEGGSLETQAIFSDIQPEIHTWCIYFSTLGAENVQDKLLYPHYPLLFLTHTALTKQSVENQSPWHYLNWEAPAVAVGPMQRCAGNPTPVYSHSAPLFSANCRQISESFQICSRTMRVRGARRWCGGSRMLEIPEEQFAGMEYGREARRNGGSGSVIVIRWLPAQLVAE